MPRFADEFAGFYFNDTSRTTLPAPSILAPLTAAPTGVRRDSMRSAMRSDHQRDEFGAGEVLRHGVDVDERPSRNSTAARSAMLLGHSSSRWRYIDQRHAARPFRRPPCSNAGRLREPLSIAVVHRRISTRQSRSVARDLDHLFLMVRCRAHPRRFRVDGGEPDPWVHLLNLISRTVSRFDPAESAFGQAIQKERFSATTAWADRFSFLHTQAHAERIRRRSARLCHTICPPAASNRSLCVHKTAYASSQSVLLPLHFFRLSRNTLRRDADGAKSASTGSTCSCPIPLMVSTGATSA